MAIAGPAYNVMGAAIVPRSRKKAMTQAVTNQAVELKPEPGAMPVHHRNSLRRLSAPSPVIASVHGHAQAQISFAGSLDTAVRTPAVRTGRP